VTSRNLPSDVNGSIVKMLTRFNWYWLRSDESCLLFTRYNCYILQV